MAFLMVLNINASTPLYKFESWYWIAHYVFWNSPMGKGLGRCFLQFHVPFLTHAFGLVVFHLCTVRPKAPTCFAEPWILQDDCTARLQLQLLSWTRRKEYESRKSRQCDWLNGACSEVAVYVIGMEWSKNIESRIPHHQNSSSFRLLWTTFGSYTPHPKGLRVSFPPKKVVLATLAMYKVATSGSPTC
jgi:hypothetical protein